MSYLLITQFSVILVPYIHFLVKIDEEAVPLSKMLLSPA